MVGASKILTVSYGTFSCTLEGFDEPFSTMKAIAEYFRDLAAADRYFGAEPPTPDAEMLHRIAEREIQRRVEAKISENGVILRQTDAEAPEPVAIPQTVAASVAGPVPNAIVTEAAINAPEAEPESESVAAKLMRIRAAVAASRTTETASFTAADVEDEEEMSFDSAQAEPLEGFGFEIDLPDLHRADIGEETDDTAAISVVETAEEPALGDDINFAAIDAATDEVVTDDDLADALPEEATFDLDLMADEELADLEALDAEPVAEDISAEEPAQMPELAEADLIAGLVAAQDAAPEVAEEPVAAEDAAAIDLDDEFALESAEDIAAMVAEDGGTEAEPAALETASEPFVLSAEMVAEDMVEAPEASDVIEDLAQADDEAWLEDLDEALADDDMPVAEDVAAEVEEDLVAAEAEEPEVAEEPAPAPVQGKMGGFLSRARARVIKVRKAVAETDEDEDAPAARSTGDAAVFEDDLVAALREDVGAFDTEDDTDSDDRRRSLAATAGEDDAIASRLMDEAATKLQGAENRRKFSAISHLKAAVAATVADRKLKPQDAPNDPAFEPEDEMDVYRDDLSKAVRPRRPVAEVSTPTRRPTLDQRPAPLVLVSEQRVDRPADLRHEGAVIRPRRITSGNLALTDDEDILDAEADRPLTAEEAQSFAEFADRMGATSLSDLLEAAAAYTASVEGRPCFSRPQILKKVAYVADDGDYSREDGLRSFGMLLRQGKIQKVRRGQFALTDNSKFMVEARRAAR